MKNKPNHIINSGSLPFYAILILIIANAISLFFTIKLFSSFSSTGSDVLVNVGIGGTLSLAQVLLNAMLVYSYIKRHYMFSVMLLIAIIPLTVISVLSSTMQMINSINKTDQIAIKSDQNYRALVQARSNYLDQINELKSHPYYNERNPVNKSNFDKQINEILKKQGEIDQKIANFSVTATEYSEGFRLISEWVGVTVDGFKMILLVSMSVLIDVISWICSYFLVISSEYPKYRTQQGRIPPTSPTDEPPLNKKKKFTEKVSSFFKSSGTKQQSSPSLSKIVSELNIPTSQEEVNSMKYSKPKKDDHPLNIQFGINKETQEPIVANIAEFPHAVIAGFTGSGKSSLIKAIITQLIKRDPSEVKLLPIDLKEGSTFTRYNNIPHLEKPIASNNLMAIQHLDYLIEETKRRQEFLTRHDCDDIDEYIKEYGVRPFHYLVAIFEEIAVLMEEDKKANGKLRKITSTARSAGVHCILCTQYPKDSVLSSSITTNCPVKICFALDKSEQSRVVLGEVGAEKLKGKGNALFKNDRHITNIQTIFYEKNEIKEVVNAAIEQYGENILEQQPVDQNIQLSPIIDKQMSIHQNIIQFPTHKNIPQQQDTSIVTTKTNLSLADQAKNLRAQGLKQVEIGKRLGIPQGTVSKILRKG